MLVSPVEAGSPSEPFAGGCGQVVTVSQGQRAITLKSTFLLPLPHPSFLASSTNLLRFS